MNVEDIKNEINLKNAKIYNVDDDYDDCDDVFYDDNDDIAVVDVDSYTDPGTNEVNVDEKLLLLL